VADKNAMMLRAKGFSRREAARLAIENRLRWIGRPNQTRSIH
jgi:hypothetical protein